MFVDNCKMSVFQIIDWTVVISYNDATDNVDEELLKVLIDSACLLVASKAREVVLSALGFIKTLLLSFSANFGPFLNQVVSMFLW